MLWTHSEPTPPPHGMRTIPCSGFDITPIVMILTTGLIIESRLDARKLEGTLTTLIERKFPRAGARIALRNGAYEFQIPERFGPDAPCVNFTVKNHPEAYRADPSRPTLPMDLKFPTPSLPSLSKVPDAVHQYLRSSSCPQSIKAIIESKKPMLHVHVTLFDDVTFIGVTSSHVGFDAVGTGTLLNAWTRLINGTDIDAIKGMPWDVQPFASFAGPTQITKLRGWFNLGILSQMVFIAYFICRLFRDSNDYDVFVHVPKSFLEEEKRKIIDQLKKERSSEWVGSSDVLTAWWYKTALGYRVNDRTPFHLYFPVNIREKPLFLGQSTLETPYINNAVAWLAIPPLPVKAFHEKSLTELALHIRRAILAYDADPEGLRDDMSCLCANPFKTHFPCPPGGEFSSHTNWRVAGFGGLDFSGAVVGEQVKQARVAFVFPVFTSRMPYYLLRGSGAVLMEDEEAIWLIQKRGEKDWDGILRSGSVPLIYNS
ncbi:hypothetical protein FB45DRAFT_759814 [Roridomyces roridus]|uniref:Uncharacterized protein n=1 Tax=Roridomyces roridus TaxID=1738132 RepID=A0AAD7FCT7_9AGAR|nr:hypothetical protein FB45DRAFT_759814 [Roridomyces roridus]